MDKALKLSIFLNFLIPKLPAPKEEDLSRGILEAIDMDSYRAEKKATLAISLPDADAEIDPWSITGGGHKPQPELDKLSNIIKAFNDQFGGLFNDPKAVEKRIIEVIPPKVSADPAYQNAKHNSDRQPTPARPASGCARCEPRAAPTSTWRCSKPWPTWSRAAPARPS